MTRFAHITGWGMAVPERVLTNDDLVLMIDTSDEWIFSRTGIRQRHIATDGDTTASLATRAAVEALQATDLDPHDIQLIIVSTSTPEHIFPATACLVQDKLGANRAGAFDLSAACTGFIYALNMAAQAIRSGSIDNALVIGAETLSRFVDWEDRKTCILFADGAGALVLQARESSGGVLSCVMRSDGSGADLLSLPAGGSYLPTSFETVSKKLHTIHMKGRDVFRFATRAMASSTREAVAMAGMSMDDIDLVVPHQANQRIIESAARGLKLSMDRFVVNLEHYGNTSTASIPIAICEAVQKERIKPGNNLVLVGFGAGLTWGAMVIKWMEPEKRISPASRLRRRLLVVLAVLRSLFRRIQRRLEGLIWGTSTNEQE
jgi:3-oxoacyl-[acyl-carrier-protein] synthase-3